MLLTLLAIASFAHPQEPLVVPPPEEQRAPREVSGVYPSLAMFNDENECGVGGVVAWADQLWAVTYSPHSPKGSSDQLYSISADLELSAHPASVGGTPACRLVHAETQQLVLGPYVIDAEGAVRVIPPDAMPGRLTGVARHLTEPERKVYFATMEEGLYEVDLVTLEVTELYADDQGQLAERSAVPARVADLPGYHGKGLYSGQGRLVYANNGEPGAEAQRRPDIPSGCLAEWDGERWRVVRRAQFTEVTGPGSIDGNERPADPLWSIGWDHRSLILMCLDGGEWHSYRLPKASHCYDGAHGWNTEWPRIRDVGEERLLMTMHGSFWWFPRDFSPRSSAGIEPRSSYLRVIGDVERWGERLVFGCDDAARSEFLNTRRAKGELAGPGRSHSNLWFVDPAQLMRFGPLVGRGAVWLEEAVAAGTTSEPFLFSGFPHRGVHLAQDTGEPLTVTFEVDPFGDGHWYPLSEVIVPPTGYRWWKFPINQQGAWIRARVDVDVAQLSVAFQYGSGERRGDQADPRFEGLGRAEDERVHGGLLRARGDAAGTLAVLGCSADADGLRQTGYYELNADLELQRRDDEESEAWHRARLGVPQGVLEEDAASLIYTDDAGSRWRLPRRPDGAWNAARLGAPRVCREVVTERDLFHAGGIFYELPARNAGGFARLRPIAGHPFEIHDYTSFRGLLVLSGLRAGLEESEHVVVSDDGAAALWVGAVDDLWDLGRPIGRGGPWLETPVRSGEASEPYLLFGFEERQYRLSHDADEPITFRLEVDVSGGGLWVPWRERVVPPHVESRTGIPADFDAYWLRFVIDRDCTATAQLDYR